MDVRRDPSPDPAQEFYRFHAERWLEHLLVRDPTRIDPALETAWVYPQVPAFVGTERGVIDILACRRDGRLAVIELKLDEDINLPFQTLDYWLRVKWLQERHQFQEFGYFPNVALAEAPPVLYLVSPEFRFHSTIDALLRYFSPSIEVLRVGINNAWRRGVRVLYRRERRAKPFNG